MIETIKDYLVSLGFKTDNSSLNAAQAAMKKAESSVDSFASSSVKNFSKAATAVVSFVATANVALGKYLVSLAQADLQTEMFARKMWMSKDAAKAYQSSIDALGVSVNDLYLSPELMDKYLALNAQARDMGVPMDEYSKQMQGVRDITFEFQRLKLEGTYALQWIGYYLTKYLAGPLGDSRDWLRKINDEIQQKMPEWSKRIAEVASWAVRLGKAAWYIRDGIGAVMAAITAFKIINMATNPIGALILGMTALLLLVDDYLAFENDKSGKSSVFNDLWRWVDRFKESLKDDGTIGEFKNDLLEIVQDVKEFGALLEKIGRSKTFQKYVTDIKEIVFKLGEILHGTGVWFDDFFKTIKENGDLEKFGTDIGDLVGSFLELIAAIEKLMLKIGENGFGEAIKHNLINLLEIVDGLIKSITGGLQVITGILSADLSKVNEGLGNIIQGAKDAFTKPKKENKLSGGVSDPDFDLNTPSVARVRVTSFKNSLHNTESPTANWSSLRDSIPGANTDASNVDWSALKKGFVAFMNSIPKEFGDISKGLFQTAKGYGDSGALGGAGAMGYLYPQASTSNMSQLSVKQTYHIYGASNPEATATTVNRTSTSALTRWGQGVNR